MKMCPVHGCSAEDVIPCPDGSTVCEATHRGCLRCATPSDVPQAVADALKLRITYLEADRAHDVAVGVADDARKACIGAREALFVATKNLSLQDRDLFNRLCRDGM